MTQNRSHALLLNWAKFSREEAENDITAEMFKGCLRATEPIETFSTWLLVATAAVASFMISNAEKIMPVVSETGFLWCGSLLLASCVFGLASKMYALGCRISSDMATSVSEKIRARLDAYEKEETEIQKQAKQQGLSVETEIRMSRVMVEFSVPAPWWQKLRISRAAREAEQAPNAHYKMFMKNLNEQGLSAFVQALLFIAFLGAGFGFAATT